MSKKVNYDIISNLNEQKLIEGIKAYYENAKELFESGKELSNIGKHKYGYSTALIIFSVEELVKSYACFQILIGDTTSNSVPVFTGNRIHQTRFSVAYLYMKLFKIINENKAELIKTLDKIRIEGDKENFKSKEDIIEWASKKIPESDFIKQTEALFSKAFTEKIEIELNDSNNWFSNAQTIKENGMYVNFKDGEWTSPVSFDKITHEEALTYANSIFKYIEPIIEEIINADDFKLKTLRILSSFISKN